MLYRTYIIKTLTGEEVEEMHSLLKQYHPYIVERHGKAGLTIILSVYTYVFLAAFWSFISQVPTIIYCMSKKSGQFYEASR